MTFGSPTFPVYIKAEHHGKVCELSRKTAEKIEFHHGVRKPIETVQEVLSNPDRIYSSSHTDNHFLYYKGYKRNKYYVVVVIDLDEGRIDTAYISNKIKGGECIWKNS